MKLKTLLGIFVLTVSLTFGENAVINVTPKGEAAMVLSPDKKRAYVVGWSGQLDVVDLEKKVLERTVVLTPFNSEMHLRAVCQNDIFGIVVPVPASFVFVINSITFAVTGFDPGVYMPTGCAFSRDGKLLYITSDLRESGNEPKISIVDQNLKVVRKFRVGVPSIYHIASSPTEDKLYLAIRNQATKEGWLGVMNGQELTKIINLDFLPGFLPNRITFSPDGRFAFIPGDSSIQRSGAAVVNTITDEIVEFLGGWRGAPKELIFSSNDSAYAYILSTGLIEIVDLYKKSNPAIVVNDGLKNWDLKVIRRETSDTLVILQGEQLFAGSNRLSIKEIFRTPVIYAVTNGASFAADPVVSPGEWISIFGRSLSFRTVTAKEVPLPTELEGTRVWAQFGNVSPIALPLVFASINQVNAQFPTEVPVGASVKLWVEGPGNQKSDSVTVSVAAATPALFAWPDQSPILADASGNLIFETAPGNIITLYATGLGQVQPPVVSGVPAPFNPLAWTVNKPEVLLAGYPCEVLFWGLSPGGVGLYQINLRVPLDIPTGKRILTIHQASNNSPEYNITISEGSQ